jgi:hypothetical protein
VAADGSGRAVAIVLARDGDTLVPLRHTPGAGTAITVKARASLFGFGAQPFDALKEVTTVVIGSARVALKGTDNQ